MITSILIDLMVLCVVGCFCYWCGYDKGFEAGAKYIFGEDDKPMDGPY